MDKKYLIEHLTKLTKVICGKENVDTVFAQRLKSGRYEFGYEDKVKKEYKTNTVTKQVAIILSCDVNRYLEYKQTKKKKDVPHKRKR